METLDAKALRIFMAVARFGAIRGAAEFLGLAPSIVSRQIAETERNIGLPLFDRTTRGVVLTDAGELVLEHGKRVLEDSALLSEQIGQLRGVQQIRVRICCGEGFLADLIGNGLGGFMAAHPAIRYFVQLGSTGAVIDCIANGDADIGVAYNPVMDTRIRSLAISRQPLCLIAPRNHPLLEKPQLSLVDCLSTPYALLSKGHGVTHLVGRVAADHGMALAPVIETPSIEVLCRFVSAGLGVTFLPGFAASTELARDELRAVELSDSLLAEASAHLFVKARRRLPESVGALATALAGGMMAFRA